jgi:uncharacterized protein (TIGR02246 family)
LVTAPFEEENPLSDLAKRLQAIEDRSAIVELTARYCQCALQGDAEGVVELFTDDGVMEMGDTIEQGRERLLELYRVSFADLRPIPCVHNHVVELDGDRATGKCTVELRMVEEGEAYTAAGWYEDSFQRAGDGWRFSHRKLFFYHRVPLSKGWS